MHTHHHVSPQWRSVPPQATVRDLGLALRSTLTDGVFVYTITDDSSVQEKVAALSALSSVEYAEPDGVVHVASAAGWGGVV